MILVEAMVFDGTKVNYAFESFIKAHLFIKAMEEQSVRRKVHFDYQIVEK